MPTDSTLTPLSIFQGDYGPAVSLVERMMEVLYEKYAPEGHTFNWSSLRKRYDDLEGKIDIYFPDDRFKRFFQLDTARIYADRGNHAAAYLASIIKQQFPHNWSDIMVADFGTGNGQIFAALCKLMGWSVQQAYAFNTGNFLDESVEGQIPFKCVPVHEISELNPPQFHCIVLHTILHHLGNPYLAINTCRDLLRQGGKVIVIESLVNPSSDAFFSPPKDAFHDRSNALFQQMDETNQRVYLQFMDWLFCRVFGNVLDLPATHLSYQEWKAMLNRYGNPLTAIERKHMGFVDPSMPFFHSYYVLQAFER